MKNSLKFSLYLFLSACSLGLTKKASSPVPRVYAESPFSELKRELIKNSEEEKRKEIIKELNKPVSDFYSPVDTGQVSCVYGFRNVNGAREFHKGIDIGIVGNASLKFAERPDVFSVAPGIVDFAGNENGYGKVVKIKHNNNLETIYAHLNNLFVEKGDSVLSGQKIGEMGRTGKVHSDKNGSGVHLHFEARKNNKPFNPNKYFKSHKKIRIDDIFSSSIVYLPVEKIKQPDKINLENISEFSYEIQIAASLNPLSKGKINALEKFYSNIIKEDKNKVYKNEKEIMYYKYSIKKFKSLEEALKFRNSLNSNNNLGIIVYKNGKMVETKWNF